MEFSRHERVFTLIGTSRALSKHTATRRRQLPGNANPETRKQSAAARLCAVAAIAGASMRYVWRMELRTRAPGYEQTRGMFTVGEATNREFPAAGGQRPGRVKLGSSEGSGGPEGVETPQTFHMSLRTPSGSLVGGRTRRTEVARFKTARAEIPGGGKGLTHARNLRGAIRRTSRIAQRTHQRFPVRSGGPHFAHCRERLCP